MLSPMDGAADKLLKGDLSGAVKEAAMEAGGGRVFKAAGKGIAAVKRHAGKLDEAVGALSHADDAATATATGVRESIEEASSVLAKEGGGVANSAGAAERGGLNLFRAGPDGLATREAATGWRTGDRMLHLPNQGSAQANWAQNAGRLRQEMRAGEPIFDSYRNSATGLQIPAGTTPTSGGRFLNAERNLLESRGWQYNPSTGAYHPPTP